MTLPTKDALLAQSKFDKPLTAFDGLSASIVKEWVITSPNSTFIPQPPWGVRHVRLRRDFRYGFDDFTLWPQACVESSRHLAAIPTKPTDPKDPLNFLWWNMEPHDFTEDSQGLVSGLGQLASPRITQVNGFRESIESRTFKYMSTTTPSSVSPKVQPLLKSLNHTVARLVSIPATFRETKFGLTEFQRLYLELHGLLDFLEIYLPRIKNSSSTPSPTPEPTANCVGAFTTNPQVAQEFFDARIPVFFVRRLQNLGNSSLWPNIHQFLWVRAPDSLLELSDASPPFPTIFQGYTDTGTDEKHTAIHSYSRSKLTYMDPFGVETPVNVAAASRRSQVPNHSDTVSMTQLMNRHIPSSISSSESPQQVASSSSMGNSSNTGIGKRSHQQSEPQPQKRAKTSTASESTKPSRDKFSDYSSSLLPPCIEPWIEGLEAVNQNVIPSYPSKYVLPNPYLFVTPKSDKRKASLLRTWVLSRSALRYALNTRRIKPLSSQGWRTFLDSSQLLKKNDDPTSKAAQCRQRVQDVLGQVLSISSLHLVDLNGTEPVLWRGEKLPEEDLPTQAVVKEIMWELFELNFRVELFAVDKRQSLITIDDRERELRLLRCFANRPIFLLDTSIPSENVGLASSTITQRRPYLLALAEVMQHWRGCPAAILAVVQSGASAPDSRYKTLEKDVAKFYAQSFFDLFGRAAVLPRRRF